MFLTPFLIFAFDLAALFVLLALVQARGAAARRSVQARARIQRDKPAAAMASK